MALLPENMQQQAPIEKPMGQFAPLPEGVYPAIITGDEIKPTKAGGMMLSLTFEIFDGAHKGRKIWNSYNIKHANADVENFAKRDLGTLGWACRLNEPLRQTEQLRNVPITIKLIVKHDEYRGEPVNAIKAVDRYDPTAQPVREANFDDVPF